jgi:DNA-binding response OmpR family regulator
MAHIGRELPDLGGVELARIRAVLRRRLRQAPEPSGCDGLIQTVRGNGYRFSGG